MAGVDQRQVRIRAETQPEKGPSSSPQCFWQALRQGWGAVSDSFRSMGLQKVHLRRLSKRSIQLTGMETSCLRGLSAQNRPIYNKSHQTGDEKKALGPWV